jgi:hypothetical protein
MLGLVIYPALAAALVLPVPIHPGPFDDRRASIDFLQTLWQVVAAALGLSVAMVAFAFEGFMSSGQRLHGGTLREFARETRLLAAIRLGALALLVDGGVLLGLGHEAPKGWAAVWATALSAATLVAVPVVIGLVVRSLDFRQLRKMRRKRLSSTVDAAIRHQLLGQAAEVILQQRGADLLITRGWLLSSANTVGLQAGGEGEVRDVWLGPLSRLALRRHRSNQSLEVQVLAGLGDRVDANTSLMAVRSTAGERDRRRVMRAVRLRSMDDERADRRLLEQLAQLHTEALAAIREGRVDDWRDIGASYELVLLSLPNAAAKLGVSFAGAVAAPGFFGFGPMQRIADYLLDELRGALDANDSSIVDAIAYLPQHVALEATRLGAAAVAAAMLGMYPTMYYLASQRAT